MVAYNKFKLTLRIPKNLKEELQKKANEEDLSMNQLINKAIKKLLEGKEEK